ncbi:sn-glycerol-3-phosphate ABC transporter ATP-binding protein UgpC [Clostridium algoriphilum]|uniref:ABC transporter ATP-binding protein n=1 Tax=Clostridium algoriphilum TaxID=198347 RepID=UPI001CF44F7B|nr:sn-glycerol-3-phosphate ABC transporter ATP-binding protein UgpC [Clostridium algoriphilum]MCB2295582.1 sn-glycerol-3-phosphate ABC transporter ATP-binding protein UgpC [Clostridium algoriphilum]
MSNLSLRHLNKVYTGNVTAVKDFNLEIEDKEFIVFVGPSGCGKSTTLRMIAGLEDISQGEIYIGDKLVNNVAPKDRDIAMVFQNYALYPHMTVYDNMAFALKLRKIPKNEIKQKVTGVAKVLDIEDLLQRKPKALSGGQRQRVALGRAIVRNPKVFLMDEPLSNLDAKLRAQMRTEISKLHHKLQTTFIYVTHDQTEAMTMGTRIVVMKNGLIQQVDTPRMIYEHPVNMFVAGFIGSPQMNFIEVKVLVQNGEVVLAFNNEIIILPKDKAKIIKEKSYINKSVIMGIRPENIEDRSDFIEEHKDAVIEAQVEVTELMGAETYIYMKNEDTNIVARVNGSSPAKAGDKIKMALDASKIHIFDKKTENTIM